MRLHCVEDFLENAVFVCANGKRDVVKLFLPSGGRR